MKSIILGAGGHAGEVLDILTKQVPTDCIALFNNTIEENYTIYDKFEVFCKNEALTNFDDFYLGVGNIAIRKMLSQLALNAGLTWKRIKSECVQIGQFETNIHPTVDLMMGVVISSNVAIGKGVLLNRRVNIHHDVRIGDFCEIAPSVQILGNVDIGDEVFIGAGSVIMPKVKLGAGCKIGAGSVVNRDVEPRTTVVGVPAKKIK